MDGYDPTKDWSGKSRMGQRTREERRESIKKGRQERVSFTERESGRDTGGRQSGGRWGGGK